MMTNSYEAVCISCGETHAYRLTAHVAQMWACLALRCPRCGGWVVLDRGDVGSVGSTVLGTMDGYKPVTFRQGVAYR